jgi:SAM-dependent methyltransferase
MEADPALTAYEPFAAIYNDFNHGNDYEKWLGAVLLPELRKHGLPARGRALDVACGTGRAFRPLLRRGWEVEGCDLSPAMLALAAREGKGEVRLSPADMRNLPHIGNFDLVLSLNDSVNYLLGDADLILALSAMRRNLAEDGLVVFDVNSRSAYASGYFGDRQVEREGSKWLWSGRGEVGPAIFESEITGDRLPDPIRHLERFRSEEEVRKAMREAGVAVLAALGMREEGDEILLSDPVDERRDYKLVFIGAKQNSHQDQAGR